MPKQHMTAEQKRRTTRVDQFIIKVLKFYRNAPTGAAAVATGLPQDKATDAILLEKGRCDAIANITEKRIAQRMAEPSTKVADLFDED